MEKNPLLESHPTSQNFEDALTAMVTLAEAELATAEARRQACMLSEILTKRGLDVRVPESGVPLWVSRCGKEIIVDPNTILEVAGLMADLDVHEDVDALVFAER
jgi:hypothetical protein